MADKQKSGLLQRFGSGFDRYIGGLLGEDLEGLSPEEKSAARRSGLGIIARGLIDPSQGSEALGAVTQARAQQRARGELERRTAAAEAEMPRIAGRLFGGSAGMIESLPGQPEEESRLMTSRYRIDPQDAMARLTGTQVGRDAAKLAPDLATFAEGMAKESAKPKEPTKYEFRSVDGVGLFAINPNNPTDMRLIQREKKVVSPAQPQLQEVYLPDGRIQDQWVLPGATVGTPLGAPRTPGSTKTLSDTLVTKLSLAQSLRDSESEIAKLNPSVATSAWETNRSERMKSSELKQYEATARRWAQNLNYYKSGATSGPTEVETNWQQYFPVAGDGPAEIALKNRQRRQEMTIIESVLREAGVKDLSLNPYPMIKGDKDPAYLRLRPGDVYMDESGNYMRKK